MNIDYLKSFFKLLFIYVFMRAAFLSSAQPILTTNITVSGWYTGTNIYPASQGTNFWLDFNLTNRQGYYIYQSILATNDIYLIGVTNLRDSRLISIDISSLTGNRKIGITTNFLPRLNTNGLVLEGSFYTFTLTNRNEFIITARTNKAGSISLIWQKFGQ